MNAIQISSFGAQEVLRVTQAPVPEPGAQDVLIRVHAAGVARADILQREGKYPPPVGASAVPGLDIAGVVESCGKNVSQFKRGDRVCAILAGGGYAEFCAVPAFQVLPIPENWTFVESASLPENLFTAYDNLVTRARLTRGETVLIHGGSSGVGSMAIMLARAVGAIPIVTAGTGEKCAACVEIGAERAINYKQDDFVRVLGASVNVVLDLVGGAYLARDLDVLATEGRIVFLSTGNGRTADLDIAKLMTKRAAVMGSTLRARSPELKGQIRDALLRDIWPLLPAKKPIRPVIDSTFPLEQAAEAHRRMESSGHVGKIVLTIADSD